MEIWLNNVSNERIRWLAEDIKISGKYKEYLSQLQNVHNHKSFSRNQKKLLANHNHFKINYKVFHSTTE